MAKKIRDVVAQARYILGDSSEPYRYTEEELVIHANNATSEARRIRPDMFDGTHDLTLEDGDIDSPVALSANYFVPLVFYVAGMAELGDDEHANSGRAVAVG